MKPNVLKIFLFFTIGLTFSGIKALAVNTQLFSIGRSKDANEIIYSLNIDRNNKLNAQDPIQVSWLKITENNKTEPLTWIQQKFSYGVIYLQKNESYAKFHFAGYSGRIFELKKNSSGKFNVYAISDGKEVIVNSIYIYITGGTFWLPEIPKVELYAELVTDGKNIVEIIKT